MKGIKMKPEDLVSLLLETLGLNVVLDLIIQNISEDEKVQYYMFDGTPFPVITNKDARFYGIRRIVKILRQIDGGE